MILPEFSLTFWTLGVFSSLARATICGINIYNVNSTKKSSDSYNFWIESSFDLNSTQLTSWHGCHCGPNSDHWSDSDHLSKMVRFLVRIWHLVWIFNSWCSCLALSENFDGLGLTRAKFFSFKICLENYTNLEGKKIQFLLAEIDIIRYMKWVKTELLSSKFVQFSKQISNANILALVRDNPSTFSLRGCIINKKFDLVHFGQIFGPNLGDLGLFLRPKGPFLGPELYETFNQWWPHVW